jgi:hypothetical protein
MDPRESAPGVQPCLPARPKLCPPFAIETPLLPAITKMLPAAFPAISEMLPAPFKNAPCSLGRVNSFQALETISKVDRQFDWLSLQFLKISLQIGKLQKKGEIRPRRPFRV